MTPGANNIEVNVQHLGTALCLHFSCCVLLFPTLAFMLKLLLMLLLLPLFLLLFSLLSMSLLLLSWLWKLSEKLVKGMSCPAPPVAPPACTSQKVKCGGWGQGNFCTQPFGDSTERNIKYQKENT